MECQEKIGTEIPSKAAESELIRCLHDCITIL